MVKVEQLDGVSSTAILEGVQFTSNGYPTLLEQVFVPFQELGSVGRIPILKMPEDGAFGYLNYGETRKFMAQVVAAGPAEGLRMFCQGDFAVERFQKNATTGFAIEMILGMPHDANPQLWNLKVLGIEAARSVVYRRNLVKSVIAAYGRDVLEHQDGELVLFSAGSGMGRTVFDVICELDNDFYGRSKAMFADTDSRIIEASRLFARERGLGDRIHLLNKPFVSLGLRGRIRTGQIFEATGLTDYLEDKNVLRLFGVARRVIETSGVLVVTNIISDREQDYLDIVWGRMHRRSPARLAGFALAQGFSADGMVLILDPTETMCTLVARV